MEYLTRDELKEKYNDRDLVRLSNEDDNEEEINWTVIDSTIVDASEKINEYLESRYDIENIIVPNTLKRACLFLVIYYLKYRKGIADDNDLNQYKEAIQYLEQLRDGKVKLSRNYMKDLNIYSQNEKRFTLKSNIGV